MLEALTQVAVDGIPLLLVAYDTEYPEPLRAKRPVPDAFGMAFVLAPARGPASIARIDATLADAPADTLTDPLLETLRVSIPAARGLPLLRLLALRAAERTTLDYLDVSRLAVQVEPCR
jgi:hypothetical protein